MRFILHKMMLNGTLLAHIGGLIISVRAEASSNITVRCSSVFIIDFEQVFAHLVDTENSS